MIMLVLIRLTPDNLVLASNANVTEIGGVAGHNTATTATNPFIAIDDNLARASLNGSFSTAALPELVLGPGRLPLQLPSVPALPSYSASSDALIPSFVQAENSMFKTVATVEYDELIQIKLQAEHNVQIISSLQHQISALTTELSHCRDVMSILGPSMIRK